MDTSITLLFGLAMAVGLVGVLVPVLPGLLIVAVAAVSWAWLYGGLTAWAVAAVMLVILALGTVAKYVLPSRTLKDAGAPRSTLLLGALGALVGFFTIPVAGLVIGAMLGVFLGELRRLHDGRGAWRSTWETVKAVGIGMVLELAAGLVAVGTWLVAVLVLR